MAALRAAHAAAANGELLDIAEQLAGRTAFSFDEALRGVVGVAGICASNAEVRSLVADLTACFDEASAGASMGRSDRVRVL